MRWQPYNLRVGGTIKMSCSSLAFCRCEVNTGRGSDFPKVTELLSENQRVRTWVSWLLFQLSAFSREHEIGTLSNSRISQKLEKRACLSLIHCSMHVIVWGWRLKIAIRDTPRNTNEFFPLPRAMTQVHKGLIYGNWLWKYIFFNVKRRQL